MRYWLDIPPEELSREWLLDEHRSLHAWFGGLSRKNFAKWVDHVLWVPYIVGPWVMYDRHEALVREFARRGYNHKSPLEVEVVQLVADRIDEYFEQNPIMYRHAIDAAPSYFIDMIDARQGGENEAIDGDGGDQEAKEADSV
jgi:hypothetical protein